MSTQITTAFVNQFSQNIQLLSQQMGSLLRNSVRQETVTGEKAFSSRSVRQWRRREPAAMLQLPLWIHPMREEWSQCLTMNTLI